MNNNLWVWGYVLDQIPGSMPFVNMETHCSLETAADYLNADNAVFMNSTTDRNSLNDTLFAHMKGFRQVVCGLQHGKYAETAEMVSRFSKTHPNVTGAIIDDFRDSVGPSAKMSVEDLKRVYEALKSENPELKLYLVRYSRQDQKELIPYLDYFDVINFWVWVSTDHYWRSQYHYDIEAIRSVCDKPILQGTFLHNYGEDWDAPIPMDMLKLQCPKIADELRAGTVSDWIVLQNGWFCRENHREQIQWLKAYLDWFRGTWTRRA